MARSGTVSLELVLLDNVIFQTKGHCILSFHQTTKQLHPTQPWCSLSDAHLDSMVQLPHLHLVLLVTGEPTEETLSLSFFRRVVHTGEMAWMLRAAPSED